MDLSYSGCAKKQLSDEDFTELFSLGQTIPGQRICNISVLISAKHFGLSGAILALTDLLLAPFCIIIALGATCRHWGHIDYTQKGMHGVIEVVAGLILGTSIKLALKPRKKSGSSHLPI